MNDRLALTVSVLAILASAACVADHSRIGRDLVFGSWLAKADSTPDPDGGLPATLPLRFGQGESGGQERTETPEERPSEPHPINLETPPCSTWKAVATPNAST